MSSFKIQSYRNTQWEIQNFNIKNKIKLNKAFDVYLLKWFNCQTCLVITSLSCQRGSIRFQIVAGRKATKISKSIWNSEN
jgi:hypothetical protein